MVKVLLPSGQYSVNPGTVDNRAIFAYENGQCHALALAINKKYGWELAAILCEGEYDLLTEQMIADTMDHTLCISPWGTFIDIRGEHEDMDYWGGELVKISRRAAIRLHINCRDGVCKPNLRVAKTFVEPVIRPIIEAHRR